MTDTAILVTAVVSVLTAEAVALIVGAVAEHRAAIASALHDAPERTALAIWTMRAEAGAWFLWLDVWLYPDTPGHHRAGGGA